MNLITNFHFGGFDLFLKFISSAFNPSLDNGIILISIKKNESTSQLVFVQSDDKEKLEKLKKSFKNEGQLLNALLNEFILTNIPAMAH